MQVSHCPVCRDLPDFAAARPREGERLPAAVSQLSDVYPEAEGYVETRKDYQLDKECPRCGQRYTLGYHYEFSAGHIDEVFWIERRGAETGPLS